MENISPREPTLYIRTQTALHMVPPCDRQAILPGPSMASIASGGANGGLLDEPGRHVQIVLGTVNKKGRSL